MPDVFVIGFFLPGATLHAKSASESYLHEAHNGPAYDVTMEFNRLH